MTVKALAEYRYASRDALENYKGKQLLYVNWEQHRMFSRPFVLALPPETIFSVIIDKYITDCYSYHPDFAQIDWSKVVWQNSTAEFAPDPAKSLKDNGIGHKDLIRFTTPGLNGLAGSGY